MDGSKASVFELTLEQSHRKLTQSIPSLNVLAPCTSTSGIEGWTEGRVQDLAKRFDASHGPSVGLWVPASGAATRMFGPMRDLPTVEDLWTQRKKWALGRLWEQAAQGREESKGDIFWDIVNGGDLPKALLPFHNLHDGELELAIEAHIRFWDELNDGRDGTVMFTVQASHRSAIDNVVEECEAVKLGRIKVHLNVQDPKTDTPILLGNGEWLTDAEGKVQRRPGGHGSLLSNLNDARQELVVVRNIDNAPSPSMTPLRMTWTQAMLEESKAWSSQRDEFLMALQASESCWDDVFEWLHSFIHPSNLEAWPWTREEVIALLDRPMRLVGVVRNEGQPGGGPFWVRHQDNQHGLTVSAQIVESVEFDESNAHLLKSSTHFNPVDMVCVLGPSPALHCWVDEGRHLIAEKDVEGQAVRVLEHPGLWNGAMSGWLTRFVEIPSTCFQPAKTVMDLLNRY